MKRFLRVTLVLVATLSGLALLSVELAYRFTVASLAPFPALTPPAPLPPKVAAAIWAAEGGVGTRFIPRLYPWTVHRYFDQDRIGLIFAWVVAREFLQAARERGQLHGNLEWHLKGIAATAWVTRNMSADEIFATYAALAWAGGPGRGLNAGAQRLFGKDIAALDERELALLLGILQNPYANDPVRRPERALARRNLILERFVQAGCLPASELAAAQAAPLGLRTPVS